MKNTFNISPFIKTAAVAIALMTSSVPSASHADLLGSIAFQGLADDLSFDRDMRIERVLALADQGICVVEDIDKLIKEVEGFIKDLENQINVLQTQKLPAEMKERSMKLLMEGQKRHLEQLIETYDNLKERPADADAIIAKNQKLFDEAKQRHDDALNDLTRITTSLEEAAKELKIHKDNLEKLKKKKEENKGKCAENPERNEHPEILK